MAHSALPPLFFFFLGVAEGTATAFFLAYPRDSSAPEAFDPPSSFFLPLEPRSQRIFLPGGDQVLSGSRCARLSSSPLMAAPQKMNRPLSFSILRNRKNNSTFFLFSMNERL